MNFNRFFHEFFPFWNNEKKIWAILFGHGNVWNNIENVLLLSSTLRNNAKIKEKPTCHKLREKKIKCENISVLLKKIRSHCAIAWNREYKK